MKRMLNAAVFLALLPAASATALDHCATAQLLLVFRMGFDPAAKNIEGASSHWQDRGATQRLLIGSPIIIQRAVNKRHLDALRSLQYRDAVAAISKALKVTRADEGKAAGEMLVTLGYEGPDGDDCLKILAAIIESYQAFIGETFVDPNEEVIRLLDQARQTLHAQLTDREKAYQTFRRQSPLLGKAEAESRIARQRIEDLERASTQAQVEVTQWKARLDLVEAGLKRPDDHTALLLLAAKPFLESNRTLPAAAATANTPQVYAECLRQELKVAQARVVLLDNLLAAARQSDRLRSTWQVQDETYRGEIARIKRIFDVVMKRLEEIRPIPTYGTIVVKVVSPPTLSRR